MIFDTHMHTKAFSSDGRMSIEEVIQYQKQTAMGEIGVVITEHFDYHYVSPDLFHFDVEEYFTTYRDYRSASLLLGVEIGLQKSCMEMNKRLAQDHVFDMVLGSIHLVNGYDISRAEYYHGKSKEEAYGLYLKEMLHNIERYDDFDTLTHIDFITRYAPYADKELYYEPHREVLDEIFQVLIAGGKALEINTRRFASDRSITVIEELYKRYRDLGGEYITLGSDAHEPRFIGYAFHKAQELIKKYHFRPVYFKDRIMND